MAVALIVGASVSGCSTTHRDATAANQCAIAGDALAKIVKAPIGSAYKVGKTCHFGIGKNSGKHGTALSLLSNDVILVAYNRSNVDSLYRSATVIATNPLRGVGTAAVFWDRGDGDVQVFARTSTAFCWVVPDFSSASQAGLRTPPGLRTIAKSDGPQLAARLGTVCNALFGK